MPFQSSRPHLPRVQSLVCLGIVNNILYLKKIPSSTNMNSSGKGIQSQYSACLEKHLMPVCITGVASRNSAVLEPLWETCAKKMLITEHSQSSERLNSFSPY